MEYGIDREKIYYIPNYVSKEKFYRKSDEECASIREKYGVAKDAFVVLGAGQVQTRKGVLDPKSLSEEDYAKLIKEQPAYGNIICRCEMITEGEIMDAINRPLGAKSLDGVKRRTRAGMGR